MNPSDMRPGASVRSPVWPEGMRIHGVERIGSYVRVTGSAAESGAAVDVILTQADVRQLEVADVPADAAGNPQRAFLATESMRYGLASADDPLSALHASAMDALPHQIEAVYGYALRWPRVRFMLAHVSGAGKTVMAGLIVKELVARRSARGALVVAPERLHEHWRRELAEKFGVECSIADRDPAGHARRSWDGPGATIASAEFIEREDVMPYVESSPPDIVIVDEAHALPLKHAPGTGGRPLAEVLPAMSEHLLLLTATPPPAGSMRLRRLLDILRPGFLADPKMMRESTDAADNPLFLRRTAGTMTNLTGEPLFGGRTIKALHVSPSEIEALFYNAVREHVKKRRGQDNASVNIARLMSSGVYAALQAMEGRVRIIKDDLHDYSAGRRTDTARREESEAEIKSLDRLIVMARRVLDSNSERKVSELRRVLKGLEGAQALVITESADTLRYLEGKVASWGYEVCVLHDQMGMADRVRAEESFRAGADVMVATEAAGEGVNLQFCANMINYDIPWEPDLISRRLGYLRRYGNAADVSILNMLVVETPQGEVIKTLLDFLDSVREETGSGAIFDYAGSALGGDALQRMVSDAATGAREPDAVSEDLQVKLEEWYHREGRRAVSGDTAARPMDLAALSRIVEDSRTHKVFPEYAGDALGRALDVLGGKVRRRTDGLDAIDYVPPALRLTGAGADIPDGYPAITFDASRGADAQLVAPGHPMYEAVAEWISKECMADAERGALFMDPDGVMDGHILFHELDVRDGTGAVAGRKLVAHYVARNGGKVVHKHPAVLWDLQPGGEDSGGADVHAAEVRAAAEVFAATERYRDELLMERRRLGEVQERYGLESLDGLIRELADKMGRELGSDRKLRAATRARAGYEEYRNALAARMPRRQEMVIATPRMVAWARVVPGSAEPPDTRTHMSGIKAAMAYERRSSRLPVDVSGHSMGYDIESRDAEGRARYIAVRARKGTGGVSLTPNELRVSRNTGSDYYLYVIYDGTMARVPDPGHTLAVRRGDIRHAVSADDIQSHAEPDAA